MICLAVLAVGDGHAQRRQTQGADYTTFLTEERGFEEVTSVDGITATSDDYYLLVPAETTSLIVGVGAYEAKPDWASGNSKALRYVSAATDPVLDLSLFFTIEKSGTSIGLRSVVYSHDLFQTHDNAGFMYVNTYTDTRLDEWSSLTPTWHDGYWLFESGKYPLSGGDRESGYLGPWNKTVTEGDALALNRKNTADDAAGHFRLFHIGRQQLMALKQETLTSASASAPVDATWLLTNPSFETGDETGWVLSGKDPAGNDEFKTRDYGMTPKDGNFLMNAWQWWAPSLSVVQTAHVPSGVYELSAVVCTWANRTVVLSGNETSVTVDGINDQTGIPVTIPLTIGVEQTLTVSAGSTGQWWVDGHTEEKQTFFKVDDVRLVCKGLFLNALALPLPNDQTTALQAGQWYYYDVDYASDYLLIGQLDGMVCCFDGSVPVADVVTSEVQRTMTLDRGRVFFKASSGSPTLLVTRARQLVEGTFTAAALNVDGLPKSVAGINLNADGPGEEGTKKISQYLMTKGYDLIGTSEDFNYHGSLMTSLNDYESGTVRSTISLGGVLSGGWPINTDGLNLVWNTRKMVASNESWTRWSSSKSGEGNQYVKKGFRHYDVTVDGGYVMDVYVLHMDAGGEEYAASREGQWSQLADAVNGSDLSRPKLILGDTNSRWTREEIGRYFTERLDSRLTMGDVWVELCRGNVYPNIIMGDLTDQTDPADFSKYEVVDKIIYVNPTAANTLQLSPRSFLIEQDYTYNTVDHSGNMAALGDHRPVVVTFSYTIAGEPAPVNVDVVDDASGNSLTLSGYDGLTANVTLSGRTLYGGNKWNTLCLPFSLSAEQLALSPLAGASIKTLQGSTITGRHVLLTFGDDVESIVAGRPYIVKWETGDDITDAVFEDVVIAVPDEAGHTVVMADGQVKFIGSLDAFTLQAEEQPTHFFLNGNNQLVYPMGECAVNACRAYFIIIDPGAQALEFSLDFGGGADAEGIRTVGTEATAQKWYTLYGRRLKGRPTAKGIYVCGSRRVVVR